jgi:hypothetical protein
LYGRHRGAALVETGCVTATEINAFTWSVFALLGGAFAAFSLVQAVYGAEMTCLIILLPRRPAQGAVWLIQTVISGTTLFYLWARNGDDFLARVAPALRVALGAG